ncbi:signal peptidase I [Oxobacter pfennigii]|nr:signal peptidase I [Oxobacter pfennigii]
MNDTVKKFFKEWIYPIILALVIAVLINKFLFFKSKIPSSSMHPAIMEGDHIFVTRVYNKGKLQRGDIVLFNSKELNMLLVKRLIGLPGDKIVIDEEGLLHINGEKIDEPYVVRKDNTPGNFEVPEDCYLFLGDNRAESLDSRFWKMPYISEKDIVGKAWIIVYPFNRIQTLH